MKTHPITDHVPESELLAITPEGAARWFKNNAWTQQDANCPRWWSAPGSDIVDAAMPEMWPTVGSDLGEFTFQHGMDVLAAMIGEVAQRQGESPRTIIVEMQADSRIAAECARMAGKKKEAA